MEDKIILTGDPICGVLSGEIPMAAPNECPQCTCGECNNDMPMVDDIHVKFTDLATVLQDSVLLSWKCI